MIPPRPIRRPRRAAGIGWRAPVLGLTLTTAALVQAGGLALDPAVVAGGGARSQSAGGCLAVTATIGQESAASSSGGGFVVEAGFWPAVGGRPGDALFNEGFQECL